jgi:hypothetical protein
MNVFEPGSIVDLPFGGRGRIIRVIIEAGNAVSYVVVWWDGLTRLEMLLQAFEVELVDESVQVSVGFQKIPPS